VDRRRLAQVMTMFGSGGAPAAFDPASMFAGGKAGIFYNTAQLDSLFQDRSLTPATPAVVDGPVGTRKDLSGNGNHQIAAADSRRPLLRTSGGLYWLEYDGVDDYLSANSALTTGANTAMFFGCSHTSSVNSVTLCGSFSDPFVYTLVLQSGNGGPPFDGSGTPTLNVDGAAIGTTKADVFTALASASGATPHLAESRNTAANSGTGYAHLTTGFYPSFGGLVRDYGLVCISEADLGTNQAALRTWFGQRMGIVL
jgi:hypothetical protein